MGYVKAKTALDFTGQERVFILHVLGPWQPRTKFGRFLCLNSWSVHLIRILYHQIGNFKIRNSTFLPDENAYFKRRLLDPTKEQISPVIMKFIVWRRSLLIFFIGASGVLLLIQMVTEIPKIADRFIDAQSAERTHNQMREMLSVSSMMDNEPGEELAAPEDSNRLARKLFEQPGTKKTAMRLLELSEDQEFQNKAAVW